MCESQYSNFYLQCTLNYLQNIRNSYENVFTVDFSSTYQFQAPSDNYGILEKIIEWKKK